LFFAGNASGDVTLLRNAKSIATTQLSASDEPA